LSSDVLDNGQNFTETPQADRMRLEGGNQCSGNTRTFSETDSSDDDERETKRQKVEDRVRELERQNEEMKEEHTEALATKQLEIDRLTTE